MTISNDEAGRVLVLPDALDEDALQAGMGKRRVQIEPASDPQPFAILDCFDQSLRRSGRVLVETGGELHLLSDDGKSCVQSADRRGGFIPDLAPGPVRDALADFPALRALQAVCRGELETRSVVVLDAWRKTQARAQLRVFQTSQGAATLASLQHLRGYDKAYEALRDRLLQVQGGGHSISALYSALTPDAPVYEAKPAISLGTTEPAFQAANHIISTFLAVARQNEPGVIADVDTEFLHDYRVSLRKIRSVLSLFRGVYSEDQTAQLKAAFSDQMAPTGRLRDLDVYLLEQEMYFDLLPDSLHDGLRVMFARFQKERAAEHRKMVRRFRSEDYAKEISALAAMFDNPEGLERGPNADLGAYDYACRLIWKRYRKVCKLARSITDQTPDEDVHDLRILCKKLRYLMEFFAPLFDANTFKAIFKPLKKLQDNLGLFNDYAVQQESLLALASDAQDRGGKADARMAMAIGGLIAILNQRQRAERARVVSSFQRFDSQEVQQMFRTLFHKPEGER